MMSDPNPATPPLDIESMLQAVRLMETRITELESNLEAGAREKSSWEKDRKLLRLVADHVEDLIAIVDCHGRRIWNNQAYSKILGYDPKELEQSYSFLEIHPDDQMTVASAFADTLQKGFSDPIEYRMQHKDGSWVNFESRSRAVHDSEKRVEYVILVARDITERSRVEEEKAQSSQIKTLSVVAQGIASEFNDIITAMREHINAARQAAPPGTPVLSRLTEAERSSLRANEVMQRLSYIIGKDSGPRRAISPAPLLQDIAAKVTRLTPARCEFLLPNDLREILGEEDALRVVFSEILTNAAQAMKTHGVIRVLGENIVISPDQNKAEAGLAPGRYVAIHIMDQGQGIPHDVRPHIFEPYFTTKPHAIGMGLTTALSIVKRHGGNIWVKSTQNVGTTVTILQPAPADAEPAITPAEPTLAATPSATVKKNKGTVLIMDDEPLVCEFASAAFDQLGYTVTVTNDGARAIEAFAKARFKGTPFDLIFLDITVPNGVGGFDAYLVLHKMNPEIKVIMVSGNSDHPVMKEPAKHGIKATLRKPYTPDSIQKAIQSLG